MTVAYLASKYNVHTDRIEEVLDDLKSKNGLSVGALKYKLDIKHLSQVHEFLTFLQGAHWSFGFNVDFLCIREVTENVDSVQDIRGVLDFHEGELRYLMIDNNKKLTSYCVKNLSKLHAITYW